MADDAEGNRTITDVALPPQQERDKAESVLAGGSDNPGGETDTSKKGVTQTGIHSQSSPIFEAAVESGPSREIGQANRSSALSIPHDGKLDGA